MKYIPPAGSRDSSAEFHRPGIPRLLISRAVRFVVKLQMASGMCIRPELPESFLLLAWWSRFRPKQKKERKKKKKKKRRCPCNLGASDYHSIIIARDKPNHDSEATAPLRPPQAPVPSPVLWAGVVFPSKPPVKRICLLSVCLSIFDPFSAGLPSIRSLSSTGLAT